MTGEEQKEHFKALVGEAAYGTWIKMLKALVPGGRTHRLSVVVAGILAYTSAQCDAKNRNPICDLFEEAQEDGDYQNAIRLLGPLVKTLFKEAGVGFERTDHKGRSYSIVDQGVMQFLHWEDMPWE